MTDTSKTRVNTPRNHIHEGLSKAPVREWPCRFCKHLREAKTPEFGRTNVVCGWWDNPVLPRVGGIYNQSDPARSITRKYVYGPHTDEPPLTCPTFEPISDNGNDLAHPRILPHD